MSNTNSKIKIYLGIDWGEKRLGLALADSETKLALAFKTVNFLAQVLEIIKTEKVDKIILGKPIKLSNEKEIANDFQKFYNTLKNKTNLEIILEDERLSTKAGLSLSGRKKDKADKDALSAALILQNYLDKNSYD
jgi:putative holliday junction resolvase